MRSKLTRQSIILATIFLFGTTCNSKFDLDKEEQKIRKVWSDNTNSICNGNWKLFSEVWHHGDKVSVVHPHIGEWVTGWQEVKRKYEKVLTSGMRCNLKRNDLTLHISNSGDMAWGTVDMIVEFNDSTKTTNHPWQTIVFEKINEEWKLVYLLSTIPKIQ